MVEGARLEIAYSVLSRVVGSNPTRSAIPFPGSYPLNPDKASSAARPFEPTPGESEQRDRVLAALREAVIGNKPIPMAKGRPQNPFGGQAGEYSYLFEGEDDLLHLAIERRDGGVMTSDESTPLARFLLPEVPEALTWLRPGEHSHHYYLGHDVLLERA